MLNFQNLQIICVISGVFILLNDAHVDLENDTLVLYNMFKNITELKQTHGWFSGSNSDSPCSWNYVYCNNDSRVVELGRFYGVGNVTQYINTTFWPSQLQDLTIYSVDFSGEITFKNIPNTIKTIDFWNSPNLQIKGKSFPNSLPNLKYISLIDYISLDMFPNFANYTSLEHIIMRLCNIEDTNSFVSTVLPPNILDIVIPTNGLTGYLNFETLMPNSPYLNYINAPFNYFSKVNFGGLNKNTTVRLDAYIVCDAQSYFVAIANVNGSDSESFEDNKYSCIVRTEDEDITSSWFCTGEQQCFDTCVCFELSNDWTPGFNDFYTYVLY